MTPTAFLTTRSAPFRVKQAEVRTTKGGPRTVVLPASASRTLRVRMGILGGDAVPAVTGRDASGINRHDKGTLPGKNVMPDNAVSPQTLSVAFTPRAASVLMVEGMALEQPGTTLTTMAISVSAPHAEAIQVIMPARGRLA